MNPLVVPAGEGATIQGPAGGPLTFKVRAEQTDGALTVFENVIAPGDGPPAHLHEAQDESWYLLEGALRFKLAEELSDARAGSFVFVPRGTVHCFKNIGEAAARILVIFNPAGMEPFFDGFAELESVSPEAFARLGDPVGMKVVGPPL
jgi:quercetin dioxygenase-like cupin family protein